MLHKSSLAQVFLLTVVLITTLHANEHGSIVVWGRTDGIIDDIPAPNKDFIDIAAGYDHCMGLRADGSIVAWGENHWSQCNIPSPNADFVAISANYRHSLGLKADGSVVAWGHNQYGQCDVPLPNTSFIAISAGYDYSLGLKTDGSIVAWGADNGGRCDVPLPNTDFVVIAAGGFYHSLGLKANGSVVTWGCKNRFNLCDIPLPNTDFVAIEVGASLSGVVLPWHRQSAIETTLLWGGLAELPATATDVAITASGSMFTRTFDLSFNAPADDIQSWIAASPRLSGATPEERDGGRVQRYDIIPGEQGAIGGWVELRDNGEAVVIHISWS